MTLLVNAISVMMLMNYPIGLVAAVTAVIVISVVHTKEREQTMAVICTYDGCEAENEDYENYNGTYWFRCYKCGWDNEVVYAPWK